MTQKASTLHHDVVPVPTLVEPLPPSDTLTFPTHPLFLEVLYEQILRDFGARETIQQRPQAA